ncbi:MAG: TetR/AcrR family transcriptional regulator [Candidatus Acidulodesulfobacterium acidiphilum]|jgi:AcrR family transcriptional regulator|uniref:TetR/AcrR family transcriptional regulator n=1 Tax=Candidatus Acidulodesulfobacterium acidiphilum TaxID=2597224 RepID=A0A520X8F9_9DELT|nr:TetR/AcrR family transcriptional regulator [Deltaproteobacteria bacterium]RZV37491.1 MAG: TetR/AcrR family transcriptional regulator [Candidatus Acidulodesulfobacterium acidiphilum]
MKTSDERSLLTQKLIIKKSMELFVLKGYHNTSLRDIAAECGISTGAIYHHFSSKEEIAVKLFNDTVLFLNNLFKETLQSKKDTKYKIKELVLNLIRIAEEDRITLEYALNIKHKEIITDGKPICSSGPFEMLRTFLKNEMQKGNIKKMDSYVATVCLTGIPVRLIQIKWDNVIKKNLDIYKEEIFESVWRTLKP